MSTPQLDMSLDDIIKQKVRKKYVNGSRYHRRSSKTHSTNSGSESGPFHRFSIRHSVLSNPYLTTPMKPVNSPMRKHPILTEGGSDSEEETKLYISNLDYDVSNTDIEILFSDVGKLERCSIHCDKSGRSKGTAEVVFSRRMDAIAAIRRYNNVQLDGKPMKIDMIGGTQIIHAPPFPIEDEKLGAPPRFYIRDERWDYGSCSSTRVLSSWGSEKRQKKLSVEDLNADLDRYRVRAKKIL